MQLAIDIGSMQYSAQEREALARSRQELWQEFQNDLAQGALPICHPLTSDVDLPGIKALARELNDRYRNVLLLGIGGSALGARTLLQFCPRIIL